MSAQTKPFFFVSSGRSGTKMMERLFSSYEQVEMHHEYMVHLVQPAATKYYLGLLDREHARALVAATYGAAIHYSAHAFWGDSSNKLTWLIDILAEEFPSAKFIYLTRDGRKVASSYFNKLGDECFDDRSAAALARYIDEFPSALAPPPEKKYWWPQPRTGTLERPLFLARSQFERIAWHWAETHRHAQTELQKLPQERWTQVKLEELVSSRDVAARVLEFIGLPAKSDTLALLERPHNVNRPENFQLTPQQNAQFWAIAGLAMRQLGIDENAEYAVNY